MAGKRIRELPLRSTFDSTCFLPSEPIPEEDSDVTGRVSAEQISAFSNLKPFTGSVRNAGLAVEVDTGALTISLMQSDGDMEPASGSVHSVVEAIFRKLDETDGGHDRFVFDEPLSITIPSGATLGYANGVDAKVFVYLYSSGSGTGIAVSSKLYTSEEIQDLITITDTADTTAIYSDNFTGEAAIVCIGSVEVLAITTAGVWTAPDILFSGEILPLDLTPATFVGLPVPANSPTDLILAYDTATGEIKDSGLTSDRVVVNNMVDPDDTTPGHVAIFSSGVSVEDTGILPFGEQYGGIWLPQPADGWVGIAEAMEAAADAGGGTVWLQPGAVYEDDTPIVLFDEKYRCDVHLKGNGAILRFTGTVADGESILEIRGVQTGSNKAVNNIALDDTSITLTTAVNAALYFKGDVIAVAGTDAASLKDVQYFIASDNGNSGTGVVPIVNKAAKAFTSCEVVRAWGSKANTDHANNFSSMEDFSLDITEEQPDSFFAVYVENQREFTLKNIQVTGMIDSVDNVTAVVTALGCFKLTMENVTVIGSQRGAFSFQDVFESNVKNCSAYGLVYEGNATGSGFLFNFVYDTVFEKNLVERVGWHGFSVTGSLLCRRLIFSKNNIVNCKTKGIGLDSVGYNCIITDNYMERCLEGGAYVNGNQNTIVNNRMHRCGFGVYTQGGVGTLINGNFISESTSYGIIPSTTGSIGGVISNNTIVGGGGGDPAIYLSQVTSWSVVGNLVKGRTGRGIQLESASTDCLISSNIIIGTSSDGMKFGDDCGYNLIMGNHLRGLALVTGTATTNEFIGNKET